MITFRWFKHSFQIALIERTRRRRQFGRSTVGQVFRRMALVVLSIAGGISAYAIGRGLIRGELTLPLGVMQAATTTFVVLALVIFTRRASIRFERVDLDHLLTTVTALEVVLGVAGFLYGQYISLLALPVVSLAVGFGIGAQAPGNALAIVMTVTTLLALIAVAGVTLSLAGTYLGLRSPRFRRYRTIIVYGPLVVVWFALTGASAPIDRLVALLRPMPSGWFVDLALLGAPGVPSGVVRSLAAICLLAVGLPVLSLTATALGKRGWGEDEVSAATLHRSRSLVGDGFVERVFSGWVSRPVLTVARKRWVQELRVPRAFMMVAAWVLCIGSGIAVYAFGPAGTPAVAPLVIAFASALGFGLGFGEFVIAAEYPSLPMTLTTASGRHVTRGTMLVGLVLGVPLTTLLTIVAGIVSPIGPLELLLVIIFGNILCGCSITIALALGTRFEYTDFLVLPMKLPLASVRRVYGRMGKAPFLSAGTGIGVVGLVTLPAFLSYFPGVVTPLTTRLGTTPVTVRIGALVVAMILAVAVSVPAYRRAVNRFDGYTLP